MKTGKKYEIYSELQRAVRAQSPGFELPKLHQLQWILLI